MEGTQMQVKSYPNSFGDFRKAGWEFIEEMDFVGHAEEVADLAVALLSAPNLPQDVANIIILGPSFHCKYMSPLVMPLNWIVCWVTRHRTQEHRSRPWTTWGNFTMVAKP